MKKNLSGLVLLLIERGLKAVLNGISRRGLPYEVTVAFTVKRWLEEEG